MKWYYIKLISDMSDKYGDKLLDMMDNYNVTNLREITLEEAREFYELIKKQGRFY